jgi:hypothetical protein
MPIYAIVLFAHIVGALGFFLALGVEWLSVRQMRRAETAELVLVWLGLSNGVARVGMASMITLLISGFSMMAMSWGGVAWIIVSLGTIVLLAVLAVALSGRHMTAIGRAAGTERGPVSPPLRQLLLHPRLGIALHTRIGLALGIVFLMTLKPDLREALLSVSSAGAIGLLTSLFFPGWKRTSAGQAVRRDDSMA